MEHVISLTDGRKLGYKEYGDPNGFPIIGLHGTPGSRIWFRGNDDISKKLGIRLITIDRPGYGLSDSKKDRQITEFNDDIDSLLKVFGITKFSLFGVSGGGAYALAYATSQNPQLYKTGVVASIYPFKNGKPPTSMCRPNRLAFYLARNLPWLLKFSYKQQQKLLRKKPELYIKSIGKNNEHLCESDQEIMLNEDTVQAMVLHLSEAFKQSPYEAVNELRLFSKNWKIDFSKINSEVEIWHGKADTLSPIEGIINLTTKFHKCNLHLLEQMGHFLDEDETIWEGILRSLMK